MCLTTGLATGHTYGIPAPQNTGHIYDIPVSSKYTYATMNTMEKQTYKIGTHIRDYATSLVEEGEREAVSVDV